MCQGSAADLIKKAMLDIQVEIDKQQVKGVLLIQIHDELLFEVKKEDLKALCAIVTSKLENVVKLSVSLPVKTTVGESWGSLQLYSL